MFNSPFDSRAMNGPISNVVSAVQLFGELKKYF